MGDDMKKELKELMDLDREFCKESIKNQEHGWAKYLSKDIIMGTKKHEAYLSNKKHIVSLMGMIYKLQSISFIWEPEYAFCSDDATLGVTTGLYTRTYILEGKEVTETGKYATTWKKEKDAWKIVFDIGN